MYANAYARGRLGMVRSAVWHGVATGALALAAVIALADHAQAQRGASPITCTNPSSGFSWQIKVDYDGKTVDANPALFTETEIRWRDSDGRNYSLDRKSGLLTIIFASSTGGNFLYDNCKLEK
jgi:hypothetical protein